MNRFKIQCLSLLLSLVMVLSLTNGFTANAATNTITVTLRVEQDETTLITPVSVTLTDADKKDFGIGLSTETLTPLHALAKYLSQKKGATDKTMSNYIKVSESDYGIFLNGISINGNSDGSPASGTQSNVSWMYNVNNTATTAGLSSYSLKDKDSLTFYGIWSGGVWPNSVETYFSYFDKTSYAALNYLPFTISLKGIGWSDTKNLAGATIIAAKYKTSSGIATEKNAILTEKTDKNGNATFLFHETGLYVLSAFRKAADGSHYDISRPYATIQIYQRPSCVRNHSLKKPTKPASLKATVKKSKKKKKSIKLSWRKSQNATIYRVYISKKRKKGYKLLTKTRKTKITFKRKKGTYYVKVRAYRNTGFHSAYSKVLKIKVKK